MDASHHAGDAMSREQCFRDLDVFPGELASFLAKLVEVHNRSTRTRKLLASDAATFGFTRFFETVAEKDRAGLNALLCSWGIR